MVRCLREKIVDRTLKSFFYWLGCKIGESPGYFLVVPLLLTALCISGFQQMDYEFEPEYLGWLCFTIWSDFSSISWRDSSKFLGAQFTRLQREVVLTIAFGARVTKDS